MAGTAGLDQSCPVCGKAYCEVLGPPSDVADGYQVTCPNCGQYNISVPTFTFLKDATNDIERMKVAAVVYERRVLEPANPDTHGTKIRTIFGPNEKGDAKVEGPPYPFRWEEMLPHFPKTFSERLDRCIVLLGKLSSRPGVRLERDPIGPVRRATFSEFPDTMDFTLDALAALDYVERKEPKYIIVRPKGWNRIAELELMRGTRWGRKAFVAMRFSGDAREKEIRAALKRGIEAGGFEAFIIDAAEHNEKICDRIIAEIRKSRFLVADFSGHRQNVYYEAGFAQGLGIPVIWTCPDGEIKDAHFDTRQYNHIVWKTTDELADKLAHRIQATIT